MTESKKIAHCVESKVRTKDVILEENISFKSLLLPENILRGLSDAGFQKPSPIQFKALPLGRCGFDLTVKSKSGTGKTLVFSVIALETIKLQKWNPQVLILTPTREIAVQIQDVLTNIGKYLEGLSIQSFIGGLPIDQDKAKCSLCHVAVGTPGRVKQLIQNGHFVTSFIRVFVLDEADKLMENSFQNDINEIFNSLPHKKQIIMCSATYANELGNFLNNYMLSPTFVSVELETPLLLGLKQFVRILNSPPNIVQQTKVKNDELLKILSAISFTQCLIFSNYQTKAESISNFLNRNGWNSTFISAAQHQTERLSSLSSLKDFKCRILISTDLTSRGIDASNVDLVINYDIPIDAMTYLHRIGRAGRYGSAGNCVNLSLVGLETKLLRHILGIIGGHNLSMPILDESLKIENTIVSQENVLFAEVPDNVKEYTEKCKNEVLEMKKKSFCYKTKKSKKDNKNSGAITSITQDEKMVMTVVEEKLIDIDVTSVLKQLASGTLDLNSNMDDDKTDNRIDVFYNELLPLPSKFTTKDEEIKNNSDIDAEQNPFFILQKLSKEGTIFKRTKEKTEEKKRKRSQNYDNNISAVIFNRDEIFYKNKALFSVAKSLSNIETCKQDTDYVLAYLSLLKDKKNLGTTNVLKDDKNAQITKKNEDRKRKNYKDFLENIFSFAYRSQVIDNCNSWQDYLPQEEEKKLEEKYNTKKNEDQEYDDEYDSEENYYEENYNEYNEEYREDEEYDEDYDFEMEKEIEVNYSTNLKKDISQDPSDFSFMKWIPVESEQSQQDDNKKVDLEGKIPASEHSASTEQSSKQAVDIFTQPNNAVTLTGNNYHEQFRRYYQHCSNNLWQTGLTLETVGNFDQWFFYDWQNEVAGVRDFVQKKIYIEEMRRYEEQYNKRQNQQLPNNFL